MTCKLTWDEVPKGVVYRQYSHFSGTDLVPLPLAYLCVNMFCHAGLSVVWAMILLAKLVAG